jgi:AraC-type DNA-binding domain-containing proteins
MRAHFEKVPLAPGRSFRVEERRLVRFDAPWHFHPEIELTLIVEGRGRRFVGDSIEPFAAGDLVLLGPNLPHFWHSDTSQRRARAHSVVVQFLPDFMGPDLWTRPEFALVRRLLNRAAQGLHFRGAGAVEAARCLRGLPAQNGLRAVLSLWDVLDRLSTLRTARPLARSGYAPHLDSRAEERLARVYTFLMQHHPEPLTLPQIARVAAMTPAGFSRYFKRTSGRNVSDVLNDLRIDHAARLLRETPHGIARIAAEAGYGTLSNFNRRFRERFHLSPREYRREADGNNAPILPQFLPAPPAPLKPISRHTPRAVSLRRITHHEVQPPCGG